MHFDPLEPRRLFSFELSPTSDANLAITYTGNTSSFPRSAITVVSTVKVSKTGTLFISGTGKADQIDLTVRNGKIVGGSAFAIRQEADAAGHDNLFAVSGTGTISYLKSVDTAALPRIRRISVEGLGGNDTINVSADVPVTVRGARGNDSINVFAPERTIVGGSGTNTIRDGDLGGYTIELAPLYRFYNPSIAGTTAVKGAIFAAPVSTVKAVKTPISRAGS